MARPQAETNFGSIEGAAEYLARLLEEVDGAREDLWGEALQASATGAGRREQAIQLANYKLSQLKTHLTTSHRLLNDLRTIRRLLFAQRQLAPPAERPVGPPEGRSPAQFVTTADGPEPIVSPPSGPDAPASARADG